MVRRIVRSHSHRVLDFALVTTVKVFLLPFEQVVLYYGCRSLQSLLEEGLRRLL